MNKFFVTTAIPYVNAAPHVGHALEFVQADVISRYNRLIGNKALLLSGGDENALKNVQAAENAGEPIQDFVDKNTQLFYDLAQKLDVQFDVFQKGSSRDHHESSQKLWEFCKKAGDIYEKEYEGFYCIGCELFYEKDELSKEGECYEHPGKPLEKVSETNYFFKLSKYENKVKQLIETDSLKILPVSRKNEMLSFIKKGLQDISISRSNERAKNWGVVVPGDNSQRMYVWFDALNIYRSGLGERYEEFWPADLHVIGKGITRFHAIYWPAFLLSARIPLPKALFVHGYFTVNGQKMSKTLGNVIDPNTLIDMYGTDALRYYLLSQIPSTDDGDFSEEKFKAIYNSDLANGLGNLISRVATLSDGLALNVSKYQVFCADLKSEIESYSFDKALDIVWKMLKEEDIYLNKKEPWNIKNEDEKKKVLEHAVNSILAVGHNLKPFLPKTAEKIISHFSKDKIEKLDPLFPRVN